jgi:hypothetical protein
MLGVKTVAMPHFKGPIFKRPNTHGFRTAIKTT